MGYEPQRIVAPDGTRLVVLTEEQFDRLVANADDAGDIAEARRVLADIAAGVGTMPGDVLDSILDDGLSPVAAWRRHRNLTQAELAAATGLSAVFIGRIESGKAHGSPRTRMALAVALDAPAWTLED